MMMMVESRREMVDDDVCDRNRRARAMVERSMDRRECNLSVKLKFVEENANVEPAGELSKKNNVSREKRSSLDSVRGGEK